MTKPVIVKKSDLGKWLASAKGRTIVGPVRSGTASVYETLADPAKADLSLPRPAKPPKLALFCQTEKLFDFRQNAGGGITYSEPPNPPQTVVLGVRPCDARALGLLDSVFLAANKGFEDPQYRKRRDATVIVALACARPEPNCFCTSVGGSPDSSEGADVLMTELGDDYVLDAKTPRGEELMKGAAAFAKEATNLQLTNRDRAHALARTKVARKVNAEGMNEALGPRFDDPYWQEAGRRCLSCGVCTFLCPTCHCFDIQDERTREGGRRFRVWDTCQVLEYTQHAGGHNPRPEKGHRLRNRVYDKFKYTVDAFGHVSCVGCGRCSTNCPEGIDLIEILEDVRKLKEGAK